MARDVTVLVDGDPLVYRVGFSLEERIHKIRWRDVDPGYMDDPDHDKVHVRSFPSALERDWFIEYRALHPDELEKKLIRIPEEEPAIAFGRMKNSIEDIYQHCSDYCQAHGQRVDEVKVFLSGGDNFRNHVALMVPYKYSRQDTPRPYWYQELRDYLVRHQGAVMTDGIEADDALSIYQHGADPDSTIIATVDKDLRNVPGNHYNLQHKKAEWIGEDEARLHFWRQCLMGDRTDDIPGLHMIGEGKALKLLPEYTNERDMYRRVREQYARNMERYPEHHAPHTSPRASLLENARLLHMMRHDDDLWCPPPKTSRSLSKWLAKHAGPTETDEL